ncbi:MAG TPA: hypothetical protein VL263_17245, partial [Vicinamibacterales bacterium]|nr:hypothetical protein [Vicinamibacterales bacterium]
MRDPRGRLSLLTRTAAFLALLSFVTLYSETTPRAFNYVIDVNGTYWGIQDDDSPRVDTGSIRATQVAPGGSTGAYSTAINGFGGIRVRIQTTPAPYLNGELMRGFGLRFDGVNRFRTTQSIDMGGVTISRSVYINTGANWGRWLDTFTNDTKSPITIQAAFGGQSGQGTIGANTTEIVATSSGDLTVTPADAWVEYATPLAGTTLVGGPQVTVIGTPSPFAGAMTFAGSWLYDTFHTPLAYSGHERNFQAYVNTLTLAPGRSRSLVHFIVLGRRVDATTSAAERAAVEATAASLATNPPLADLSTAEICSVANFDIASLAIPGFDDELCSSKKLAAVS